MESQKYHKNFKRNHNKIVPRQLQMNKEGYISLENKEQKKRILIIWDEL